MAFKNTEDLELPRFKNTEKLEFVICPACQGTGINTEWEREDKIAREWCAENNEEYTEDSGKECRKCDGNGEIEVDEYFELFI